VQDLERAGELGHLENGLAVVIAHRQDGSPYASVVNAGVVAHPVTGGSIVGFVARAGTKKLPNLRLHPRVTVVFRSGWDWVAVEGEAELVGPDDALQGFTVTELPGLLREVYAAAAGGSPDDWRALDATMAHEGHTAVLIQPIRIYSSPPEED
jgi:PPOX class probable F420-dependent enzyme